MYYVRTHTNLTHLELDDGEPDWEHTVHYSGEVFWEPGDTDTRKRAATFEASLILGHSAFNDDIIWACDAYSQDLYEVAEALYRHQDLIDDLDHPLHRNVLYVDEIKVVKKHQGNNLDLAIIQRLARMTAPALTVYWVGEKDPAMRRHLKRIGFKKLPRVKGPDSDPINQIRQRLAYRVETDDFPVVAPKYPLAEAS